MKRGLLALIISCAGPALAQDFLLQTPVDCDLAKTCFIQQYVDRDPGPGMTDFMCADLSYDTHKGTDFALPSLRMMQTGVDVLAAADGVVGGVRDGMADTGVTTDTLEDVEGRECGNGVRITHDGGWVTQYCHMREGSVAVRAGDRVAAGDVLGQVGQSGRAAFPHLHLSVRHNDQVIDPFDPDNVLTCASPGDSTLWQETPAYRPGGLIAVGLSAGIPEYAAIKAGTAHDTTLGTDSPALVIWGYGFGLRRGDILRLSIIGPAGEVIARDIPLEKSQAQAFRAIGKKRRTDRWSAGLYTATATLLRDTEIIESREITLDLQ